MRSSDATAQSSAGISPSFCSRSSLVLRCAGEVTPLGGGVATARRPRCTGKGGRGSVRRSRPATRKAPRPCGSGTPASTTPGYLFKSFRNRYGVTPKTLGTELQVEECKRLMLAGVPLNQIHARAGFAHQTHFTARFRRFVGQTLRRWLMAQRAGRE